jgi:hypothetical protein
MYVIDLFNFAWLAAHRRNNRKSCFDQLIFCFVYARPGSRSAAPRVDSGCSVKLGTAVLASIFALIYGGFVAAFSSSALSLAASNSSPCAQFGISSAFAMPSPAQ